MRPAIPPPTAPPRRPGHDPVSEPAGRRAPTHRAFDRQRRRNLHLLETPVKHVGSERRKRADDERRHKRAFSEPTGRALLIYPVRSEQRYAILSLGHDRMPLDVEGLLVMQSPNKVSESAGRSGEGAQLSAPGVSTPIKESWSIAARRRRFGNSRRR